MTNDLPIKVVDLRRGGARRARPLRAAPRPGGAAPLGEPDRRCAQLDRRRGQLLAEPRGAALLTMQRITYDDHGRVVEYGTHIYAASRYSFEINLLTP